MHGFLILIVIAMLGTAASAPAQEPAAPSQAAAAADGFGTLPPPDAAPEAVEDFRLSPGDQVDISVLEDQSLNRRALVRPDGRISLPIAGTIEAAGRTPEEVGATIRARLGEDFVTPPTVTVSLVALGAQAPAEEIDVGSVFVIGQVNAPGRFDFEAESMPNALQVLAMAGGPAVFAAKKRIQIRRRTDSGEELIIFNYDDIERGRVLPDALQLVDGDVIVVPERGIFE